MTYQDNILYVDIEKLQHKLIFGHKHPKKIKLLLGKINPIEFEITIDTIKHLPENKQLELREYIRSIFKN